MNNSASESPVPPSPAQKDKPKAFAPRHGIDPVTYGLGEGAKTGWLSFLGAGAVSGTAYYIGREKLDWLKEKSEALKKFMGDFKGRFSTNKSVILTEALGVGLVFGQLASLIMHAPATTYGIFKANKENKRSEQLARDNAQLRQSVKVDKEEIVRLNEALDKVQRPDIAASRSESAPSL